MDIGKKCACVGCGKKKALQISLAQKNILYADQNYKYSKTE